ncbi:helix-turn-helix domain-containing protein [Acidicapsa ligni]|uniref:helix-turn-helix domain-containing protein n=1 Tax=Acidicapsa ligni TaxID=542300 RepID=UPI0021DFB5C8|nr:AraC family transcriptional regulator [Acidicapsa ligni]
MANPGELPEIEIDSFVLMLWQGNSPAHGEYLNPQRRFVSYRKKPGTLTLYRPGVVPKVRPLSKSIFLLCALNRGFLSQIEEEIRDEYPGRPMIVDRLLTRNQPEFFDPSLSQLLGLLQTEARSGGLSGRLYSEHLVHALAVRLSLLSGAPVSDKKDSSGTYDTKAIRRVLESIEVNPATDFDVATLAAEAGHSQSHFFRAFRGATGHTPHQYIMRLRLERAKSLMRKRNISLAEIAQESGFASHAHLSHVFRQRYGIAPSEYRNKM